MRSSTVANAGCSVVFIQLFWILLVASTWVWNFTKFVGSDFEMPVKREAIHGVGLIPPLCVVTCWFNIDENGTVTSGVNEAE